MAREVNAGNLITLPGGGKVPAKFVQIAVLLPTANRLNTKNTIRNIFGWLLLVLFSFSITPRQILHDVLADHTDLSQKIPAGKFTAVNKSGFSCDRLNLVAESPFIEDEKAVETVSWQPCTNFIAPAAYKAVVKVITLPALRGPPSI